MNAIDRGKQKRTMADIRAVATAVDSYAVDHNARIGRSVARPQPMFMT